MNNITTISSNLLKPHPKNDYFFDDITGESWDAFLESIRTSGVIEPIVISQDKTIVSGHQRVRACDELGIDTVLCDIRIYEDDDKMLKDLIKTNIRQRGIGNPNPVKYGRCFVELERIYGISHGGDRGNQYEMPKPNNSALPTQSDLAEMVGLSVDTLQNYKKLTELIPEIVDLIDTGIVTSTTALAIARNMKPDEQEEFVASMDVTKKITQKEVKQYIEENKALQERNDELKKKVAVIEEFKKKILTLQDDKERLKKEYIILQEQKNETTVVTQEVDSKETLDKLAKLKTDLDKKNTEIERTHEELLAKQRMLNDFMGSNTNYKLISHCSEITLKMLNFVQEMAKYDYMSESFNEIPDATRNEYMKCVKAVSKWANRIIDTVEGFDKKYVDSIIVDNDDIDSDDEIPDVLKILKNTNGDISEFDRLINKL